MNQNNNADIDKNKDIKIIIRGNNTIVQKITIRRDKLTSQLKHKIKKKITNTLYPGQG